MKRILFLYKDHHEDVDIDEGDDHDDHDDEDDVVVGCIILTCLHR